MIKHHFNLRRFLLIFCVISLSGIILINLFKITAEIETTSSTVENFDLVSPLNGDSEENVKKFFKCQPMFQLGRQKSSKSFSFLSIEENKFVTSVLDRLTVDKKKRIQSTENYLPFADKLPSMVDQNFGTFQFKNETRLTQLKGQLPYLPCKVRMYSLDDIKTCVEERSKKNETFWIAFIGDSKMRNKLAYFANITNSLYQWEINVYEVNETQTIATYFKKLKEYSGLIAEATSSKGPKLSFLSTRFGLDKYTGNVNKLVYGWSISNKTNEIPDAIFVDFGVWDMLFYKSDYIKCIDKAYEEWKTAMRLLQTLSKKIPVILMGQSRSRSMKNVLTMAEKPPINPNNFYVHYLVSVFISKAVSHQHSDFLDTIILIVSEGKDVVIWDSTIPFILASDKECRKLMRANHSSVYEESKNRIPFRRLMCHDALHKTESTIQDENTMILNMMCNNFMPVQNQPYCCT